MGLQKISERKVRRAATETGIPIFRAARHSNNLWFGWVREGDGHWHVNIYPPYWAWEYEPGCRFSSCSSGVHGAAVLPHPDIIAAHERAVEKRREDAAQSEREWQTFAAQWKLGTEEWLASLESEGAAPK